jgi:hypothetical protein
MEIITTNTNSVLLLKTHLAALTTIDFIVEHVTDNEVRETAIKLKQDIEQINTDINTREGGDISCKDHLTVPDRFFKLVELAEPNIDTEQAQAFKDVEAQSMREIMAVAMIITFMGY